MRQVALTAATFASAFLMAHGGSPASATMTPNINNILTNKTVVASAQYTQTPKTVQLAAKTTATNGTQGKTVTVESGDNLSTIAEANGTNYQRLYYANTNIDNPDLIFPGQQLRVPTANEQLTPRALPENAPAEVKAEVQAETAQPAASAPAEDTAPAPVRQTPQVAAPSVADGSV
jgi:LysM repeat protein